MPDEQQSYKDVLEGQETDPKKLLFQIAETFDDIQENTGVLAGMADVLDEAVSVTLEQAEKGTGRVTFKDFLKAYETIRAEAEEEAERAEEGKEKEPE